MKITKEKLPEFEKLYRAAFVNSLSGFKSANLVGSISKEGKTNLAIFNSVIHVGANPPLMGFLMRPVSVKRHTYTNIKETHHFTINHINKEIFKQAHQTSARFEKDISEFDACGLTPEYTEIIKAPYVKESKIKIGLKFLEEQEIKSNGTIYPKELQHYTTLIVQGFDLGLLLPIAFVVGYLAIKKSKYGFLYTPIYMIFLSLLMTALVSKILFMAGTGQNVMPVIFIMPAIALISITFSILLLLNIKES